MALQAPLGAAPRANWCFDLALAPEAPSSTSGPLLVSNLHRVQSANQAHVISSAHHASCSHALLAPAPLPHHASGAFGADHRRPGGTEARRPAQQQHWQQQQQQQVLPHGQAAQRLNAELQPLESSPSSLRSAVLGPAAAACGSLDPAPASTSSPTDDSSAAAAAAAHRASFGRRLSKLALRVGDMMQPQGDAPGDATWHERTANVLTSLPFLALGWHMHRQRLTPEGKRHAVSMMAVGAAATLYHATSGAARRLARKVDYWTIAFSSSSLVKCLYADSPAACRAANLSLLAVPFKPFAVSMGNALVMQTEFARQAATHKAVRKDLRRHYTAAALGLAAFFGEDLVANSGWGGFVHSAWHLLACYGCCTMNGLLAHSERQRLQRRLQQQGEAAGIKPLRRPVHSSASSLPSYGSSSAKLAGFSPGTASP